MNHKITKLFVVLMLTVQAMPICAMEQQEHRGGIRGWFGRRAADVRDGARDLRARVRGNDPRAERRAPVVADNAAGIPDGQPAAAPVGAPEAQPQPAADDAHVAPDAVVVIPQPEPAADHVIIPVAPLADAAQPQAGVWNRVLRWARSVRNAIPVRREAADAQQDGPAQPHGQPDADAARGQAHPADRDVRFANPEGSPADGSPGHGRGRPGSPDAHAQHAGARGAAGAPVGAAAPGAAAPDGGAQQQAHAGQADEKEEGFFDRIFGAIRRNPLRTGAGIAGGVAGAVGIGALIWHLYNKFFGDGADAERAVEDQMNMVGQNEQQLRQIEAAIRSGNTQEARNLMNQHFPARGSHRLRRDFRDVLSRRINELLTAEQRLAGAPGNAQLQRAKENAKHMILNCIQTQCLPAMQAERVQIRYRTQQAQAAAAAQQQRAAQQAAQQQAPHAPQQQEAAAGINAQGEPGILDQFMHPITIGMMIAAGFCLVQKIRGGWPFNFLEKEQAPRPQPQPQPAPAAGS